MGCSNCRATIGVTILILILISTYNHIMVTYTHISGNYNHAYSNPMILQAEVKGTRGTMGSYSPAALQALTLFAREALKSRLPLGSGGGRAGSASALYTVQPYLP